MTLYEGAFANIETNVANENIQQIITVKIFDTETVIDNPYQALFRVANNGDGTQRIVFTYVLPDTVTTAAFGYEDGSGWSDIDLSFLGKDIFDIPQGDYDYSMIVDGDRIVFSAGETIPLEMAETPVAISVTDNTEDKFTPIKPKQADIRIHSSNAVDISNFADGGDNRFYVEIETQAEGIIFMGFLSVADLSQDFLPDPNTINLVATDGLGFLEDEPLVNFLGETPTEKQQIINFIVWSLAKTGLALDVKACMNIRQDGAVPLVSDDTGEGHFYKNIYLDSKTFEAEIGTCEDCFTVLEKIVGENSFITQYKGKWIIVRVDEMETGHEYFFTWFSWNGDFVEKTTETYSKDIGVNLPLSFMNDDAVVSLDRPYKSIKETFNYNYPKEIICNIDFSRGEGDAVDPTLPTQTIELTPDCWLPYSVQADSFALFPPVAGSSMALIKKYEYGVEKESYLSIINAPASVLVNYYKAVPVRVSQYDKLNLGVSFRLAPNSSPLSIRVAYIVLIADSGNIYEWEAFNGTGGNSWLLNNTGPYWIHIWSYFPDGVENMTDWKTLSENSPAIPESGNLFVILLNGLDNPNEMHFSGLNLSIEPFVNGSYQTYTGQSNGVSQDNEKIKATRDTEVFISDAPRIEMKGALLAQGLTTVIFTGEVSFTADNQILIFSDVGSDFTIGSTIEVSGSAFNNRQFVILNIEVVTIIGTVTTLTVDEETIVELTDPVTLSEVSYVLAALFYNAAKLTAGPTTQADLMLYGAIQAFDVWNQFNRVMRIFEATVDRTDSATQIPDILHKYILRDINGNTTNGGTQYRIFMLLHFEMDLHLCEWAAFLVEVFNTDNAKTFETYEFKYLTSENA